MAGRVAQRPKPAPVLSLAGVDDPATARALQQTHTAVQALQAQRSRDFKVVNLVVGTNRVRHGLGRPVLGYTITPTFCTIAFGHALNLENPHPELEVWIDVVGSDQDQARVEVF